MSWCFEEQATPYGYQVLDMLGRESALVPSIWPLEVTNALRVGERRRLLQAHEVIRFTNLIGELRIVVEAVDLQRALGPVLALARSTNLSTYDASYLELAMREGLPLATRDKALAAAAARVGVPPVQ